MWWQLIMMGILVAFVPLCVVWIAGQGQRFRKLVWLTLFLTFDLILFGAFTRLTDSGLGCPDWPGCYGHADPVQARHHIALAESMLPTGPVTMMKATIEMLHRYLAMGVGILIMTMMIVAWRYRTTLKVSPFLPTFIFFMVCLQGAFGAWTVTLKLFPLIVTMHLLLALLLLSALTWLAAKVSGFLPAVTQDQMKLSRFALISLILLVFQIALGGWVSTNYAVLACPDFPLCHGQWIPTTNFSDGFSLWRELGKTTSGDYLPFDALTTIHWVHRCFAIVLVLVLLLFAYQCVLRQYFGKPIKVMLCLLCLQCLTGFANVYFQWPLINAVMHNGGAAGLLVCLVVINYQLSGRAPAIRSATSIHSQLNSRVSSV